MRTNEQGGLFQLRAAFIDFIPFELIVDVPDDIVLDECDVAKSLDGINPAVLDPDDRSSVDIDEPCGFIDFNDPIITESDNFLDVLAIQKSDCPSGDVFPDILPHRLRRCRLASFINIFPTVDDYITFAPKLQGLI